MQTTQTPGQISARIQAVYQKKLLTTAVAKLELAQVLEQFDHPKNAGTLTTRFFRRAKASSSTVRKLTEGVPPTDYTSTDLVPVDVTLEQFGEPSRISDTKRMTDILNQLDIEVNRMGEAAALQFDELCRNEIVLNVSGPKQKRYAQALADFAALVAASNSAGALTVKDLTRGVAQLKKNRAPKFGKDYIALIPVDGGVDLQDDPKWRDVQSYQNKEAIYSGEIGRIAGCRVIEHTNPFIESTVEGTYDAEGNIFTTIILGKEAAGTIKLSGTNSPLKPQFIYNDKPDKSDPLNQFISIGWKGWYAAKLLDPSFAVTIRHKTTA